MLDVRKPIVSINLTPLVDVSLVLVVIFMATAPMFLQSGIIVTSGEKKAGAEPKEKPKTENILVRLEREKVWLNQHETTLEDLPELLKRMLAEAEMRRVIINPDRDVTHGRVIRVMDIAKQSGAENLVILGKSQAEEAKPPVP
jgi:biopolymer transport protein ExbD